MRRAHAFRDGKLAICAWAHDRKLGSNFQPVSELGPSGVPYGEVCKCCEVRFRQPEWSGDLDIATAGR